MYLTLAVWPDLDKEDIAEQVRSHFDERCEEVIHTDRVARYDEEVHIITGSRYISFKVTGVDGDDTEWLEERHWRRRWQPDPPYETLPTQEDKKRKFIKYWDIRDTIDI